MKPFFSKFGHLLYQAVSTIANVSVAETDYVPPKFKPLVIGVIALAQGVVALTHHK